MRVPLPGMIFPPFLPSYCLSSNSSFISYRSCIRDRPKKLFFINWWASVYYVTPFIVIGLKGCREDSVGKNEMLNCLEISMCDIQCWLLNPSVVRVINRLIWVRLYPWTDRYGSCSYTSSLPIELISSSIVPHLFPVVCTWYGSNTFSITCPDAGLPDFTVSSLRAGSLNFHLFSLLNTVPGKEYTFFNAD